MNLIDVYNYTDKLVVLIL